VPNINSWFSNKTQIFLIFVFPTKHIVHGVL